MYFHKDTFTKINNLFFRNSENIKTFEIYNFCLLNFFSSFPFIFSFLFFLSWSFYLGVTDQCPSSIYASDNWEYFNNACYQFVAHPSSLTWHEAEKYCHDLSNRGHLVSIRNELEAHFIHYMLTSNWTEPSTTTYIGKNSTVHVIKYGIEIKSNKV